MGEATQGLEEPRRVVYIYHEGSYKVKLATRSSIPVTSLMLIFAYDITWP
jgi:hypothetical protein